jgi:uracil permease
MALATVTGILLNLVLPEKDSRQKELAEAA